MKQKYIFKDENFVKYLKDGIAYDKDWNVIYLKFRKVRWEYQWELVSPQEVIDKVVKIEKIVKIGFEEKINSISWIWNFRNLEVLHLQGNKLIGLPKEISSLTKLRQLYLWNNKFTTFPKEICDITSLENLDLSENNFITLPEEICNLKNLTYLGLYINQLTTLPEKIKDLTNLKRLDLSVNQLTTLPKEISSLTKLEDLKLGWNQLTSLPEGISNLKNLKYLDLAWNPNLWNLNRKFKYEDITEFCDKVIDADWDWKVDTVLCIKSNWEFLKLWTK